MIQLSNIYTDPEHLSTLCHRRTDVTDRRQYHATSQPCCAQQYDRLVNTLLEVLDFSVMRHPRPNRRHKTDAVAIKTFQLTLHQQCKSAILSWCDLRLRVKVQGYFIKHYIIYEYNVSLTRLYFHQCHTAVLH